MGPAPSRGPKNWLECMLALPPAWLAVGRAGSPAGIRAIEEGRRFVGWKVF